MDTGVNVGVQDTCDFIIAGVWMQLYKTPTIFLPDVYVGVYVGA